MYIQYTCYMYYMYKVYVILNAVDTKSVRNLNENFGKFSSAAAAIVTNKS